MFCSLPATFQAYDKPFPFFRKPSVLGSFSLDSRRQFHHDRRQLKYYKSRNAEPGSVCKTGFF